LQNIAVIRRIDGLLAWYPPGASEGARPLDKESEQEALRAALRERRHTLVFAVPGEEARLMQLAIATEEKRHLAKSLPYMFEEELASDVSELHFAFRPIDKLDYAVAVCSLQDMESYREQLASYPEIGLWIPEPLLLPWREGEWCLVLEGDRAIVRTGRCGGFSIEREMLPALLTGAAEGAEPGAVVIYGRDQEVDTNMLPASLRDKVQWRDGDLYTALLLADDPSEQVNLRQGSYARRLPLGRWWQQWRVAAALFAAALAIHLLASYMDYRQLQQQNIVLRTAVQDSYRKAYPRGAVVDAEKQLRRQLDALSGSAVGSSFVSMMGRVGSVVSASEGTSIVSINYSDKVGEMRLNIVASNYSAVERVRSAMVEAGLAAVMESSSAQGEKVRARLRVEEKS
jgi:general secretion pathway protein L